MAETCQFVVPGLQLAGCSPNTSGSVSMVHSSSQHEWEACVIHQFAAIPSRSHRCCCPPKPETAEHIMHPAQSHPHPPKAFRHHCISTEGNLQTGFRLWHFGSKNSHSAAVLQRGSFGTRACWGVRAITSDLGLQHLGYPLFSLAGCPPLLRGGECFYSCSRKGRREHGLHCYHPNH